MVLHNLLLIFLGLAGGFAVGSGFVAFITVLGIVPRLVQLSKTGKMIHLYEYGIVLGVVLFTWFDLRGWVIEAPVFITAFLGLLTGMFVGMLAAALAEVLNVLPIMVKRLHIQDYLLYILMAMALGKIFGSLFQWLIFQVW
ncbi:stage V sporulation protein AB [Thermoflavimicrobium dichotomicum]|uniref:Stage V sporulation protein AB n=1 Tax=Thermoflavimicrobium dichotomicum TaxID=46223 RepID=A0A1I3Q5A4_9BACL|nr:stage V sporulation protein AB [Thermoflavimicrobium dichotomicum]SFJ28597.1 stage V sporulation protein AB [Thermoflavimicrobium dichotomicum]